jgi:serine protease Do/serine protease DegQ
MPRLNAVSWRGLLALSLIAAMPSAPAVAGTPGGTEMSYAAVLRNVIPSVVTVRVIGETKVPVPIEPRKLGVEPKPMPSPRTERFRSGGSGVIVSADPGYILTNYHVIADSTALQIVLEDGRRMKAEIVGRDIGTDFALLKVTAPRLPAIKIGDSNLLQVGDVVLAVGNPFGLEGTATKGIVSATMRTEVGHGAFEDFLQIDASINPGNSGGALVNARGELVGINTAGPASGTGASGIGFAIPINQAMATMKEILAAGRVRRGTPGLIVDDLPAEVAELKDGSVIKGALVTRVIPGSSAAKAGLKAGDIVVSAAGKPVRSAAEYITRTVSAPLGSAIPFILFSDGNGKAVQLRADDIVIEPDRVPIPAAVGGLAGAKVGDILVGNPLFGDLRGAQVLEVTAGSPAFISGLAVDDVIVEVGGAKVRSVEQLMGRLARTGREYRIKLLRNGVPATIEARR